MLGAMVVLPVVAVLVVRWIRTVIVRLTLIMVLGALGLSLWIQRADLQDCADTCSCSLFGQRLDIPAEVNPNCN